MGDMLGGAASGAAIGSVVPGIGTAIGAGVGALGSLIGGLFGNPKQKYLDAAQKYYDQIDPRVRAAQVGGIQGTAYNNVDPATRAAMMGALDTLQNKYRQGGMDSIDRARAAELQQQQTTATRANSAAILDNARRTGTLNSGRALGAQMIGAQGAGAAAAKASVAQAAAAEQARMQALSGVVGTAGKIQQGDFTVAHANDALARFNKNLQVGNADRSLTADQDSVRNALDRAGGVGNLAKEGASVSGTQTALGGLGRAGQAFATMDWSKMGGGGGGGGADASDESAGLSMARQPQNEEQFAWNAPDQRNY